MVLLLLILLTPAAAALWALFGQRKAGPASFCAAVISMAASAVLFFRVRRGYGATWQFPGLPGLPFRLEITALSATLSLTVAMVSALIFLYALGYMAEERDRVRFWSGMSLFLAAMQLLIFAGDWILFVMAWEFMGYASYHLISTHYRQGAAGRAANKAFAINRFADLGLYIGVFAIILGSGSSEIASSAPRHITTAGGLGLLLAVMGKAAQVPFQSWLAAAMKGPTPVSALLHSATMVAAGIVLLLRAFPLFSPQLLFWIGTVGGISILLSGLTALFSADIKRMLAASTSSQMGFMVLAVGAGFPGAALAHLVAHAFMKSSLFLGAGIFQHGTGSTRFDKIAGAGRTFRFTFAVFSLAAVALAGLPPFIGYWSKDAVLSAGYKSAFAEWYFLAALAGALLTALYMSRAMGLLWKGSPDDLAAPGGLRWMQGGLLVMVLFVAGGGLFLHALAEMTGYHLPTAKPAKIGGLVLALVGLAGGWFASINIANNPLTAFMRNNYPVGGGYRTLIVQPVLQLAQYCRKADRLIHRAVSKTGIGVRTLAGLLRASARTIHDAVYAVGHFTLYLASRADATDRQGINGVIRGLANRLQSMGHYGRQAQSGLVHRELMWSIWGMVAFLLLMFLTLI